MKDLVDAVAQADNPYALFAVAIIGLYVLLWRWGGKLIEALRENTRITKEVQEDATHVRGAILTNHGSKNIGDAIDRITQSLINQGEAAAADRQQLAELHSAFIAKSLDGDNLEQKIAKEFGRIDERLSALEERLSVPSPIASAQISGGD